MRIIPSVRLLLFALAMMTVSASAFAQIGIGLSITIGPPALPVYAQPACPAAGYIWTPGYWAYADGDYYWVPGTWVMAPEVGLLWTPGYWAWNGAAFIFNEGYWGPQVGFYGGINYGFGYFGQGYQGGRWNNGEFFYNRAVNNINVTNIKNVYVTQVNNTTTVDRISYNGGNGGINARPTPQEEAAAHERRIPAVAAQTEQAQAARSNQQLRASVNHGKPPVAATPKPGAFSDRAAVAATQAGAPYNPAANRAAAQPPANAPSSRSGNGTPRPAVHPNDLPPFAPQVTPNTGNPQRDRQSQQQQEELRAKQNQERQELQQKQEQEHQQLAQQKSNEARKQQVEQQHQQQTQQLQERHAAELRKMQDEQRQNQAKSPKQEHPPTERP